MTKTTTELMQVVSSAVWVAQGKGKIREPSLVVTGIAMFVNQSSCQDDFRCIGCMQAGTHARVKRKG
jgi:hypothetical protein